jgi:hypothetical protein
VQRETAQPDAAAGEERRYAPAPQAGPESRRVLALQRAAGNRATGRALAAARNRALAGAGNRATHRAIHRAPLDAVPAAQRTRLREVTDALATLDVTAIHSPPGATGTRVSGSVTPAPVFGASIAAALQPVLTSVLAHLLGGALPANSTSAVLLDLTPYGGSSRVYRFTHVVSGDPPQTSYAIEEVGAAAAEPAAPADPTAAFPRGRFDAHSFSAPSGEREFEAILRAAVEMVPDRLLTPIDGVSFRRASTDPHDAAVGGRYDHQAHTVTIYDPGMSQTTARFGDAGAAGGAVGPRLRTVLHELGHAIDEAPLHRTWTARETARQAFESAFSQYDTGGGNYSFPANLQGQFNRLQGAATRADTAYTGARSLSGHNFDEGDTAASATATDFTRAVAADGGVMPTAYAESTRGEDHHLRETFAEAFSMFITEPQTLRALRPRIHAFFAALGSGRRGR